MEQPGFQDSGNDTPQPDELITDPLELDPADPNEPHDPDLEPPEEEEEEIEVDGRKFAMPKSAAEKLKAERLMHKDYTQKTQAVAERDRGLAAREQELNQRAEQQQQYIKEVAAVHNLAEQLAAFETITPEQWDAMADEDPVQAQKLQIRRGLLKEQYQKAQAAVTQKQNEHALAEERTFATQAQEAEAYVQREIPGWTQERAKAVNDFAISQGLKLDQPMAKLIIQQPALIKLLDQAEKFQQLVKKQATKPTAPAAPPPPVKRVGAVSAAAKPDPAKMTDAQWYAAEQERRRKR